ncbi:MAG: ATP-dependent metallopeptidase FtsH/Yme1/Tma family protein [Acutalibacteraceae bacterium]|nr:ATP-dependent metallopeptidase FtsH/Yme1/Tma family protein [Acutalibacteraceae bacterium]
MKRIAKVLLCLLPVLLLLVVLASFNTTGQVEDYTVTYEEFQNMIKNGKVEEVTIDLNAETFTFKVEDKEHSYQTTNPRYDDFKKDLLEQGVEVKEKKDFNYSILTSMLTPLVIFGAMMIFMNKQMGGNDKVGYQYDKSNKVTFKDVAGLKEVKEDLIVVTDFLANPDKYIKAGAKLPKGVLLYGPPGTGKTLLARAVAGEANANFISVSGSDFANKFVGAGGDRVRNLFKEARKQKPCIIFIDEIDAVGGSRSGGMHSENRNTLNALLTEMDGFNTGDGIIVIAATNRLEDLDDALVRPGRFDNIFAVPLPSTMEERKEVIDVYARGKKFDESVDLDMLAKQMIGTSPADIEVVLNEASIIAARTHKGIISKEDLDEAYLKKILKGHVKSNEDRDEEQLRLVAWHEAGHTIVGTLLGQEATKVTILPSSSGAGGFTIFSPSKLGMYSREELENRVCSLYAGRAAEELLVGRNRITTGASNDIERATAIINQIVAKYGMCEGNGEPTVLDYSQVPGSDKVVMEKMNELADKYYAKTLHMLEANSDKLEKMADELLKKETLSESEILEIVR